MKNDTFQSHIADTVCRMVNVRDRIYRKTAGQFRGSGQSAGKRREERFARLTAAYTGSSEIRKMNEFIQHGNTTTLAHCRNVAWVSFVINERLHLNSDEKELIEAAMLHDFYLYDWHDGRPERKTHGFDHPFIASENAEAYFHVSPKVSAAIRSHMWPLNITTIPSSRVVILLCLADKYCAVIETVRRK